MSMHNLPPGELINKASKELQKSSSIKAPEWSKYVKTAHFKQRPPENQDWWSIRAASILRKVSILGPIGVSKLRTKYGGKKNRGYKPEKFFKAPGNSIRKMLQQLEKEGLIKQDNKKNHKGRVITAKGLSLLNKISKNGKSKTTGGAHKAPTTDTATGSDSKTVSDKGSSS